MSSSNAGSLRPGWYNKGGGGGGGRGFQPPPTASDRGDKGRSGSVGSAGSTGTGDSENRRASNKFAALLDDDDVIAGDVVTEKSSPKTTKPASNSRSEAFRSSFKRNSSTGDRPGRQGRSLADLAASVPEGTAPPGRRHTALYEGKAGGGGGPGRFSGLRSSVDAGAPGGFIDSYKPDPKVIRHTREKLLSLRPPPARDGSDRPDTIKAIEETGIVTTTSQDPVCWDTLDAEQIWETIREKRSSIIAPKGPPVGGVMGDGRRQSGMNAPPGRWQRGVALPQNRGPPKDREADNPEELWDDPVGGAVGAASDFSAFGALPTDGKGPPAADNAFDFDKMAEASRKLEEELHGTPGDALDPDGPATKPVDASRPLASEGTIRVSGDDVNVFEDFDAPLMAGQNPDGAGTSASSSDAPVSTAGESEGPSASSRLMKMIGVEPGSKDAGAAGSNPWGTSTDAAKSASGVDPIIGGLGGPSIPLNPWGGPASATSGADISLNLGAFSNDQKNRDAQMAVEREKIAQQEAEMRRRRQEQEAQQRTIDQQKAAQQAAARQQQQPTSQQTQIELVLMERICVILENSWGQSDLVSILSTLHSEDSRVIPLLGNVDALRALIARSPQRVALRREPGFGGEMAVLQMTNSQWQQAQEMQRSQERAQQEQLHRRKQEEAAAAARAQAQNRLAASINFDAPWFYSDPQNNIQGPFRGEEMRQWLEAGYFKGDLPISQASNGPFHPLSGWFPDLNFAFRRNPNDSGKPTHNQAEAQAAAEARASAEKAELERRQKEAEEEAAQRERLAAAEAERAAQKEAADREAANRELERMRKEEEAAAASASSSKQKDSNGGNESSTQLKMMLGLDGGSSNGDEAQPTHPDGTKQNNAPQTSQKGKKKQQQNQNAAPAAKAPSGGNAKSTTAAPAPPAAPAWGGVKNNQPRKSMSEIQQEEARRAALMATQLGNAPRPSSGWANVASKGTGAPTGWSGGAVLQTASATAPSVRPVQARPNTQPANQGANARKITPVSQQKQQQRTSNSSAAAPKSSNPAEEFGITMSPALESWCKEKMVQINGSDDTTLVGFCMTLNDANEIRQYLTTYLGSTPAVNSFASEFINKRGLGSKQEEWETPGSAKKGRKKKGKA
eukprot:CAMPEP_0113513930 /NCGR_PEP_ID=MMETSP0014_2-20120614/40133_1 /TAXON_ID=2857 /ORGANISM="Nitzschia sp." /LENGTH=1130 /DNA_ID=CAMNT_0000410383 /DNA_START=105 /DNA_END=3497 /DNA_ORIENTATION=+ /assembly_acc=CAM_ASM_000159